MPFVVGIDAGGTKTLGLLADETGAIVAESRAGGANLFTHGEAALERALSEILTPLCEGREAAAVCVGCAGVDRPRDEAIVEGILRRLGHRGRTRVVNDARIALVAGASERHGIVVLAGTGSIVFGVDSMGRSARAGGYGSLLADEGSGYWLGHQVLRAAVRALDGRGPETMLRELLFARLGISSMAELISLVYERSMPKEEIASLAALVEAARARGDAEAQRILGHAAGELCLGARAVADKLGLAEPFGVVLAGGVFKAAPTLADSMALRLDLPLARLVSLEREPAQGAVLLALDLLKETA
jgi:N-acetylglucosamine kinase-like BadF-type ATPase